VSAIRRNEMQEKVEEVLNQLRVYLQADGGDIEFVELTPDNIVKVRLKGACSGCPGAAMTLQMGVERILKEKIPQVKGVEAV
jgi:Fe-S cluster biogenesis protein NfuA